MIKDRKRTKDSGKKATPTEGEVQFGDGTIPSVVYPRLMQPQMLELLILVLSKR